jgi:HEAT repeat protein
MQSTVWIMTKPSYASLQDTSPRRQQGSCWRRGLVQDLARRLGSADLLSVLVVFAAGCVLPAPVMAYIDVTPTLGRIINQSDHIVLLRVAKVNLDKRAIIFEKVVDLKGQSASGPIKHQITDGLHPREPATILDWVEPGRTALCFQSGKIAEICIGDYWYECAAGMDGWWIMSCGQAQMMFAYKGPVSKLKSHVETILAGKEAVITAVKYGADDAYWKAVKRVVAMRNLPQGNKFPMCRYKASLKMPGLLYPMYRDAEFVTQPGAAAAEDVPALIATLENKDWTIRLETAQILGQMGPAGKAAVPALHHALRDTQASVRLRAAEALTAIDPSSKEAGTVLLNLLNAPEATIRKGAAAALGNAGGASAAVVLSLDEALRDTDARVRWAAADALNRFGPEAAKAVPALIVAVNDPVLTVRSAAIDALGSIGLKAQAAMPLLNRLVRKNDGPLRASSAAALYHIDRRQAQAAIPVFVDELRQNDTRLRWHGLYYLRKMIREAKEAIPVPALISALADADFGVRGMAAWVLGEIGPRAEPAVPALVNALAANDVWMRTASAPALVKIIGTKATVAIPVLIDGLVDEDDVDDREEILRALQTMGRAANQALPTLVWLAKQEPRLRGVAAETMWRVSLEAEMPLKMLLQELKEPSTQARIDAARILGTVGPDARAAVPALSVMAQESDLELAEAGLEALRRIDPSSWAAALRDKRQEHIGWPWRWAAGALVAALLSLPICYWSLHRRPEKRPVLK